MDVLFSDAQLAGPVSGFALAQWVRRNRPGVHVVLEVSLESKTAAAFELCPPDRHKSFDSQALATTIPTMMAERRRRTKPQQSAAAPLRSRRS